MSDLSETEFTKDFGVGWGSIHNILVHLLKTEKYWISILKDDEFEGLQYQDFDDVRKIQEKWMVLEKQTREFLRRQNEKSLFRLISVEWS